MCIYTSIYTHIYRYIRIYSSSANLPVHAYVQFETHAYVHCETHEAYEQFHEAITSRTSINSMLLSSSTQNLAKNLQDGKHSAHG